MLVPKGAKAGKISKPYGLRGELNIILELHAGNSIEPDTPLFIDIDGQRVPFFVEEVELISKDQAIIKFEFIDSLEGAREVSGCSLYFDPHHQPESKPAGGDDLAKLIGFLASDRESGVLGTISDYLPHPMNPLFVIQSEDRELILPAVRDFIEHIDSGKNTIRFNLPEGLSSL
jgi:16S rRNA processing protein RimM